MTQNYDFIRFYEDGFQDLNVFVYAIEKDSRVKHTHDHFTPDSVENIWTVKKYIKVYDSYREVFSKNVPFCDYHAALQVMREHEEAISHYDNTITESRETWEANYVAINNLRLLINAAGLNVSVNDLVTAYGYKKRIAMHNFNVWRSIHKNGYDKPGNYEKLRKIITL